MFYCHFFKRCRATFGLIAAANSPTMTMLQSNDQRLFNNLYTRSIASIFIAYHLGLFDCHLRSVTSMP